MKDFDILSPQKRTAKIGGEEIDVSIIPAIVALQFISFSKKHDVSKLDSGTSGNIETDTLVDMIEIVAVLCQRSNPKITKDWLLNNVDIKVLLPFVQYVFEGIKTENGTEGQGVSEGKN
jgi:hypothetical protein